ncbi:hypothetical protein [Pseudonocardia sp. T1-2H]|uniref:hypothetical protein n=1 Tax=Pseudonocardia sp. T1-2H TaxID=3128899 RepID=UPI0031017926
MSTTVPRRPSTVPVPYPVRRAAKGSRLLKMIGTTDPKQLGILAAATREQLRADGRAAALVERVTRAEDLVDAAAAQAGELRDQVAALTATLRARDTALEEERAQRRSLVEDHRTELAARDAALAALRTEHQAELDRIRRDTADARQRAAAEHAEIIDRLRAELAAAAERRATEHAGQLAELHRQLGAADHQIQALRTRLTTDTAIAERG